MVSRAGKAHGVRTLRCGLILAGLAGASQTLAAEQPAATPLSYSAEWRVEPLSLPAGPIEVKRYEGLPIAVAFPGNFVFLAATFQPFAGQAPPQERALVRELTPLTPLVQAKSDQAIYCSLRSNYSYPEFGKSRTDYVERQFSTCFLDRDRDGRFEGFFLHRNIAGIFVGRGEGPVALHPIEPLAYGANAEAAKALNEILKFQIKLGYNGCWGSLDKARCEGIGISLGAVMHSSAIGGGSHDHVFKGDLNQTEFRRWGVRFRLTGDKLRLWQMQLVVLEGARAGTFNLTEEF